MAHASRRFQKPPGRRQRPFLFAAALSIVCSTAASHLCAAILLKEFDISAEVKVPPKSRCLLVVEKDSNRVFYTVSGNRIYFIEKGSDPALFATVPEPVTELRKPPGKDSDGFLALTEQGKCHLVSSKGTTTPLTANCPLPIVTICPFRHFHYYNKPYGICRKGGMASLCRFTPIEEKKQGENAAVVVPFTIDATLAPASSLITGLEFYSRPEGPGLFALSENGLLWRVDPQGKVLPEIKSSPIRNARSFLWDTFGLFGGMFLFSVPEKGQLWRGEQGKSVECIAKELDTIDDTASCRGSLAMNGKGTLFVLAGTSVYAIQPKKGSDLAESAALVYKAEQYYAENNWADAAKQAATAQKSRLPRHWKQRIQELQQSCTARLQLEKAQKLAQQHGHAKLLGTAKKLEYQFRATRVHPLLLLFRKNCEEAGKTIYLADFEEKSPRLSNFPEVTIKPDASTAYPASRPYPVREGQYSLKWTITPQARISFSSNMWGNAEEYSHVSLWIYSPGGRTKLILQVLNTNNMQLARYYIVLKKGWQFFQRPLMHLRMEELPDNIIVKGIELLITDGTKQSLFLDAVTLHQKG